MLFFPFKLIPGTSTSMALDWAVSVYIDAFDSLVVHSAAYIISSGFCYQVCWQLHPFPTKHSKDQYPVHTGEGPCSTLVCNNASSRSTVKGHNVVYLDSSYWESYRAFCVIAICSPSDQTRSNQTWNGKLLWRTATHKSGTYGYTHVRLHKSASTEVLRGPHHSPHNIARAIRHLSGDFWHVPSTWIMGTPGSCSVPPRWQRTMVPLFSRGMQNAYEWLTTQPIYYFTQ